MNQLEYTSRDYDTNVAALVDTAKRMLPGRWTSFQDADFGQALLELIAYDSSILSFIQDQQARESFIPTCFTYEAAILFATQNGYRVKWLSPAAINVWGEFIDNPDPNLPFIIRDKTQVRQDNGLIWEVVGNHTIPANRRYPVQSIISRNQLDVGGMMVYATIGAGSSYAYLSMDDGERLPSEVSLTGYGVEAGQVLILTGTATGGGGIGSAPPANMREFAITGVGSLAGDLFDGGVMFLDRAWAGDRDFTGTFVIESRSIALSQGITREETFQTPGTAASAIITTTFPGISSIPMEAFTPSGSAGITSDSVRVAVNGTAWHETPVLGLSGPDDPAYETFIDQDQKLNLRFGDGINGSLLPIGATIAVQYRTCDGSSGNVQRGTFNGTLPVLKVNGTSAGILQLTNPYTCGSGGSDRDSLDQLKALIMSSTRTNDRAVTIDDFKSLTIGFRSQRFGSPAAVHVDTMRGATINNAINVSIWSRNNANQLGAPSQGLLEDLRSYLDQRSMLTDEVIVSAGRMTTFPIAVRYRFTDMSDTQAFELVRSAINKVVSTQNPGSAIQIGDLYDAVESIQGIDQCSFLTPSQTLPAIPGAYVNSLQLANTTLLAAPAVAGTRNLILDSTGNFLASSALTIWSLDKMATSSVVETVSGTNVLLRGDQPLADNYPIENTVVANTDYWSAGWSAERNVDLYITVDSGSQDKPAIQRIITTKLYNLFRWFILPGDTLYKDRVEKVINTVPNVIAANVSFNAPNAPTISFLASSAFEKLVLRNLKFL